MLVTLLLQKYFSKIGVSTVFKQVSPLGTSPLFRTNQTLQRLRLSSWPGLQRAVGIGISGSSGIAKPPGPLCQLFRKYR